MSLNESGFFYFPFLVPLSAGRPLLDSVFSDDRRAVPSTAGSTVTVRLTSRVAMEATFFGFPAPTVSWTFNGDPVMETDRVRIVTTTVGEKTTSQLLISRAEPGDEGTYVATAKVADSDASASTAPISETMRLKVSGTK